MGNDNKAKCDEKIEKLNNLSRMFFRAVIPITFVAIALYWFFNGGSNAPKAKDFVNFATYVGGILSPLIAGFTLYYLYKQLELVNHQFIQQSDHIKFIENKMGNEAIVKRVEKLQFQEGMLSKKLDEICSIKLNYITHPVSQDLIIITVGDLLGSGGIPGFINESDCDWAAQLEKLYPDISSTVLFGLKTIQKLQKVDPENLTFYWSLSYKYSSAWNLLKRHVHESKIDKVVNTHLDELITQTQTKPD